MTEIYLAPTTRNDAATMTPAEIRRTIEHLSRQIADASMSLAGMPRCARRTTMETRRAAMIDQREKYRRRLGGAR